MINQEKVDQYLRGEITLDENSMNNEELQLLQETSLIKEALRINELKKHKALIDNIELEYTEKKSKLLQIRTLRTIAACVSIFICSLFLFNIYNVEFDPTDYAIHTSVRSDIQSPLYNQDQLKAYNLFIIGNYTDAIPLLKELRVSQDDTISQYYLALSYYALGETTRFNHEMKDDRLVGMKFP